MNKREGERPGGVFFFKSRNVWLVKRRWSGEQGNVLEIGVFLISCKKNKWHLRYGFLFFFCSDFDIYQVWNKTEWIIECEKTYISIFQMKTVC